MVKTLPPAIIAARESRTGVDAHALIYLTAKNRTTGAPESTGLWTGADNRNFDIPVGAGTQVRSYYGAGNVLSVPDISSRIGIEVNRYQIILSGLTDEVRQAVRTYNARLAPIEVHRAEFDVMTGALLAPPQRVFKGWIDGAEWSEGGEGGDYAVALNCVSVARALTRVLATMMSDASQRLRNPNDTFNQYTAVSGTQDVFWGEQKGPGPDRSPWKIASKVVAQLKER